MEFLLLVVGSIISIFAIFTCFICIAFNHDTFYFVYLTFSAVNRAFVAPADIQAFTSEAKNKLSARCRGKTVKYFAQAVREICEEFEQLQHKSCLRDNKSQPAVVSDVHSVDGARDDATEADLKGGIGNEGTNQPTEIRGLGGHGSGLEPCCQRQGETGFKDIKSCASDDGNGGSSKTNNFPDDDANLAIKEAISTSSSSSHSFHKESSCERRVEWSSKKMSGTPLLLAEHEEYLDVAEDLRNGHRPRLAPESKSKDEGSYEMHNVSGRAPLMLPCHDSGSNVDILVSNQQSGDDAEKRIASDGKQSCQYVVKNNGGKKVKKLLKDKKNFDSKDKPWRDVEESSVDEFQFPSKKQGQGKQTSQSNEVSYCAKRSKCVDATDNRKVLPQSRKVESQIQNEKMVEVESKRSVSQGKAENHLSMRSMSSAIDSYLSGDEDVLPPSKRRRRAFEAMSTSAALNSESKIESSSATLKNDMSRRRAVRLCDDGEEEPKTPVHGGSTKKVLATLQGPISTKRVDMLGSFADQLGKRGSGTPEGRSSKKLVPSGEQLVDNLSPNSQQAEEKRHGKAMAFRIPLSPGKLESEKVYLKESRPVPVSPRRSPLPVSAVKSVTDPQNSNKLFGKVPGNMHQRKTPSASKGPGATSESLNTFINQQNERSKPEIYADRNKATPKAKTNDLPLLAGNVMETHFLHGERYSCL